MSEEKKDALQVRIPGTALPSRGETTSYGGRPVHVPPTYQSDKAPAIKLRDLSVGTGDMAGDTPLRLHLELDVNGEAARRLAEFFGMYGQGGVWASKAMGKLPLPNAPPALPPAQEDGDAEAVIVEGEDGEVDDDDEDGES